MKLPIWLALWVLVVNWLLVPFLFTNRTHLDGFCIGLITAVLIMVFYAFTPKN